jgi:hypothetical protein
MNKPLPRIPVDRNGVTVRVGDRVRAVTLAGDWFDRLPSDEREKVESMIGEILTVYEIDEYGQPWVQKEWPDESEGQYESHSIALEPWEMEFVSREGV